MHPLRDCICRALNRERAVTDTPSQVNLRSFKQHGRTGSFVKHKEITVFFISFVEVPDASRSDRGMMYKCGQREISSNSHSNFARSVAGLAEGLRRHAAVSEPQCRSSINEERGSRCSEQGSLFTFGTRLASCSHADDRPVTHAVPTHEGRPPEDDFILTRNPRAKA